MGKAVEQSKSVFSVGTFPINKKKSLRENIRNLHKYLATSSHINNPKKCLKQLKRLFTLYYNHTKITTFKLAEEAQKIKICKVCNGWIRIQQETLQCLSCEDSYHFLCMENIERFKKNKICNSCQIHQQPKAQYKNFSGSSLKVLKNSNSQPNIHYSPKISFLKCARCLNIFCPQYMNQNKKVCISCDIFIQRTLKQIWKKSEKKQQTDFSQKQNSKRAKKIYNKMHDDDCSTIQQKRSNLCFEQKLVSVRQFTQLYPSLDSNQVNYYQNQLILALKNKSLVLTDVSYRQEQQFDYKDFLHTDFCLTHLSSQDQKMYYQYKKQPIGPFCMIYKQKVGWDIVADMDLQENTLVCEYLGDIFNHRQALYLGDNDSRMELIKGHNADYSLLVIPVHHGNIGKFINGVNKYHPQRANLTSVRCFISGKPSILFKTLKPIKKGQSLLYDYNSGDPKVPYDTSDYQ